MQKTILEFNKQFEYKPVIKNSEKLDQGQIGQKKNIILCGMGGSHLSADILKMYKPGINLYVYKDYGLPPYDEDFLKESLLIASSYSGNTEETLDFMEEAYSRGLDVVAISKGGKLIEFAQKNELPFIQLPDHNLQPRNALGYSLVALVYFINKVSLIDQNILDEIENLSDILKPEDFKDHAKDLAESLEGKFPVIYSSVSNLPLAYVWKIKFNETSKMPAFYNLFSELNHNEMQGFDLLDSRLNDTRFHFILLSDGDDNPRIKTRFKETAVLYERLGYPVSNIDISNQNILLKIFNAIILADWLALFLAEKQGIDPEKVPLIEEFKRLIKD